MLSCDSHWITQSCTGGSAVRGRPANTQTKRALLMNVPEDQQPWDQFIGVCHSIWKVHSVGTSATPALFPWPMLSDFGLSLCIRLLLLASTIQVPYVTDFQSDLFQKTFSQIGHQAESIHGKSRSQDTSQDTRSKYRVTRWIKSWRGDFDSGKLSSSSKVDYFQWAWLCTLGQGFLLNFYFNVTFTLFDSSKSYKCTL